LDRWGRESPIKHCSHRSRETPSTIRDLGDAIGPWDDDVGVDEYDSDDSFIAPEDNDEEGTETRLDSAGKENDAISSTQVHSTSEDSLEFVENDDSLSDGTDTRFNNKRPKRCHADEENTDEVVSLNPRKRSKTRRAVVSLPP